MAHERSRSRAPTAGGLLLLALLGLLPVPVLGQAPRFDPAETPCGRIFRLRPGDTLRFGVVARHPDPAEQLNLDFLEPPGLPPGATFPLVSGPAPLAAPFSWTLPPGATGSYTVLFRARDSAQASAVCRVFLQVEPDPRSLHGLVLRAATVIELTLGRVEAGRIVVTDLVDGRARIYRQEVVAAAGTERFFVGPLEIPLPAQTTRILPTRYHVTVERLTPVMGGIMVSGTLATTVTLLVDGQATPVTRSEAIPLAGFVPVAGAEPGATPLALQVQVVSTSEDLRPRRDLRVSGGKGDGT